MIWGSIAAIIPAATLTTMYITAVNIEPDLINPAVSNEKVENVVKPPHIPTFRKSMSLESRLLFFAAHRAISPIASEPTTFISSVMKGNP